MKHAVYLLCLMGLLWSCNSRPSADNTASRPDSVHTTSATAAAPTAAPLSASLTKLGLTSNHDWRKVNLGDNFQAAKTTETTKPFEEDASHIGYTQEFENLESVDYQYFRTGDKVSRIQVDFYLNTRQSVNTYRQELTAYLTARYGNATTAAGTLSWHEGRAVLKDISQGKDFGLRLTLK